MHPVETPGSSWWLWLLMKFSYASSLARVPKKMMLVDGAGVAEVRSRSRAIWNSRPYVMTWGAEVWGL
jgi:hypothetical protein